MRVERSSARPLRWDRFDIPPALLIVIPGGLLVASAAITVLSGFIGGGRPLLELIGLSVIAFALHFSWIRSTALSNAARVSIFLVQFVVNAALVWLSPFYGVYVVTGYLTALLMFSGAAFWVAVFANAALSASAQIGGIGQVPNSWPAFVLLAAINTGLVFAFTWVGSRRDRIVEEREAAVRALEAAQLRNTELQEQLLQRARERGVLEERARLSREIHDTVAQDLVAIVSQLEAIDGDTEWKPRVETAKTLARSGLGEARRAVYALRSPMLDAQPLPSALDELVRAWATVHDVRAHVRVDGDPVPTDMDQDLLRICQEALSNVFRHAEAKSVDVRLSYVDEGVLLDIQDDGQGFELRHVREGNGLRGMRERVAASGGTVDVTTQVSGGCLISVVVPA
ncbi:sensor histidine kinase [Rhodococcus sp. 1R11]|uniref:sensor histidine kinase n=1 Tax=unclassified Rhodococcus (in: high G+C Gram-positive bacteria) TaxID=192944 RepID=UPI001072234C|nr:sensor histidine kinase [Rhodococcus sp. 1R11]TFI43686.1 sensor histidine kinase [Rhodococcus sp. 1R11]